MPTAVNRLARCLGVVCATVALGGLGAGIAGADPDDSGNTPDPGPTSDPGPSSAPRGPLGQIRRAYAPYSPRPKPTLKIMEEDPVVDSAGAAPKPAGSPNLPVLQGPTAFPAIKLGPPRPLAELVPTGTTGPALGVGTAGVRAPEGRSVTQGSVQAGESVAASSTTPMSSTAYRQGFPQYLRTARVGELAIVAVPGVAGLLAITASGGAIGFRQANSGRYLRSEASRFLQ